VNVCYRIQSLVLAATLFAYGCTTNTQEESVVGDYLSGRLAASTNDVDAAASAFTGAQAEAPGAAEILRDAFFFKLASGQIDEATPLAEKLISDKKYGDDGLARIVLASRALKFKKYDAVRDYVSEGVSVNYLEATADIFKAWALAGQKGPNAAYDFLFTAGDEKSRGFYPLHLALLAEKAGRNEDAHAAYQVSIMALGWPVGRPAYGAFLERSGDETAARDYYQQLSQVTYGPERKMAMQGLARLDAGKASAAYSNTLPSEGAAIALFSIASIILEQTENEREAARRAGFSLGPANYNLPLVLMRIALYLDPDFDDALRMAGTIMNIYGDTESGIELLSRIPSTSPYYEQAQIDMAGGFVSNEQNEQAKKILRAAIRRDGASYEARSALANIFASESNYHDAVKTLDALIAQLPEEPSEDSWRYYVARADAQMRLDNWEKAERDLKRAMEIAPEQPTVLNYLGYSWAERGENLDEAFSLIEKAISLDPSNGAIIDSLGWAHYQLGHYEEAVGHLEQAASVEPGDPTITDHLGDVYWRLGRKIEARYQWERVLELEPNKKLEAAVNAKLEKGLSPEKEVSNK
jgi:tetratricopeptide (TPR) repeat protein